MFAKHGLAGPEAELCAGMRMLLLWTTNQHTEIFLLQFHWMLTTTTLAFQHKIQPLMVRDLLENVFLRHQRDSRFNDSQGVKLNLSRSLHQFCRLQCNAAYVFDKVRIYWSKWAIMAPKIYCHFPSPSLQILSLAPLQLSLSSASAWTDRNMRRPMPSWDLPLDLRMPRGRFQGLHQRWAWKETRHNILLSKDATAKLTCKLVSQLGLRAES